MLSQKTKYALQALSYLSANYDKGPMLISNISSIKRIPLKFLENILLELKNAGILISYRGRSGGYRLKEEPSKTNLATIIRIVDGPIAMLSCVSLNFYKPCENCDQVSCRINPVMAEARDALLKVLCGRTIEDLAPSKPPPMGETYGLCDKPAVGLSTDLVTAVLPVENNNNNRNDRAFYEDADLSSYNLLKEFVKTHRMNGTVAENLLWNYLRDKQLNSYKFRRQHIIGNYIADFVCITKKLIIEVDGLIHELPDNKVTGIIRTEWLESKGYKVIRFTNDEVFTDIQNTLTKIQNTLNELPFAVKKRYGS